MQQHVPGADRDPVTASRRVQASLDQNSPGIHRAGYRLGAELAVGS